MSNGIPVKVYTGFVGETSISLEYFDSLEQAVHYLVQELRENEEIRQEDPETPQLTFWVADNIPSPRRRKKGRRV